MEKKLCSCPKLSVKVNKFGFFIHSQFISIEISTRTRQDRQISQQHLHWHCTVHCCCAVVRLLLWCRPHPLYNNMLIYSARIPHSALQRDEAHPGHGLNSLPGQCSVCFFREQVWRPPARPASTTSCPIHRSSSVIGKKDNIYLNKGHYNFQHL